MRIAHGSCPALTCRLAQLDPPLHTRSRVVGTRTHDCLSPCCRHGGAVRQLTASSDCNKARLDAHPTRCRMKTGSRMRRPASWRWSCPTSCSRGPRPFAASWRRASRRSWTGRSVCNTARVSVTYRISWVPADCPWLFPRNKSGLITILCVVRYVTRLSKVFNHLRTSTNSSIATET